MDPSKIPILGWMRGEDMDIGLVLFPIGLVLIWFVIHLTGYELPLIISIIIALAPLWLPVGTFLIFHYVWMMYVGKIFYLSNGRTTLRIKLPPEVFKSPEAMEFVLSQIHNTQSPDNLMQTYLEGKRPQPISLELVSIGGDVRFYVNVPTKKTKPAIEAQLYAQYPEIEVTEELDYTGEIPLNAEGWYMMSFHMCKKKDQEFPIKTYIDYKLDTNPKEEEKVDPMTPMLEQLSNVGPNERVWVQFILTSHREQGFKLGQLRAAPTWEKGVLEKIDELMKRDPKTKAGQPELEGMPRMTPGERSTIEAMERNVDKYAYEVGIRLMYLAREGHQNPGDFINPMLRSFSQYDLKNRNGVGPKWRTDFNYILFSDPFGTRVPALKKQELREYKLRKYFNKDEGDREKIFTTEELATMWHIPGKVVLTPSLGRIQSARSEAPGNLPIGLPQ